MERPVVRQLFFLRFLLLLRLLELSTHNPNKNALAC
jgi:hypothetical protein